MKSRVAEVLENVQVVRFPISGQVSVRLSTLLYALKIVRMGAVRWLTLFVYIRREFTCVEEPAG